MLRISGKQLKNSGNKKQIMFSLISSQTEQQVSPQNPV
jgi:hypothetical protein